MTDAAFARKTNSLPARSQFSDDQILQIAQSGKSAIAAWVSNTSQQHNVVLRQRPTDAFARAVCRLLDGMVDLDPVEEMLVAMSQAGVINGYQRGLLQVHFLR